MPNAVPHREVHRPDVHGDTLTWGSGLPYSRATTFGRGWDDENLRATRRVLLHGVTDPTNRTPSSGEAPSQARTHPGRTRDMTWPRPGACSEYGTPRGDRVGIPRTNTHRNSPSVVGEGKRCFSTRGGVHTYLRSLVRVNAWWSIASCHTRSSGSVIMRWTMRKQFPAVGEGRSTTVNRPPTSGDNAPMNVDPPPAFFGECIVTFHASCRQAPPSWVALSRDSGYEYTLRQVR